MSELLAFTVSLKEEQGDKFTLVFNCLASDPDDAFDQANEAYPGCELLTAIPDIELDLSQTHLSAT